MIQVFEFAGEKNGKSNTRIRLSCSLDYYNTLQNGFCAISLPSL